MLLRVGIHQRRIESKWNQTPLVTTNVINRIMPILESITKQQLTDKNYGCCI